MELKRSHNLVVGLVAGAWLLVVGWQVQEHLRVVEAAKSDLRSRSHEIAGTLSAVTHALRFRGAVFQERLEPVLSELVSNRTSVLVKLIYVGLLNTDGDPVVAVGNTNLFTHEITGESGGALTEEHDIVYRGAATPDEPVPPAQMAPASAGWRRDIQPNDVLLFRYSALTFNGHRIHYDRRYATEVEGYPGLIVHGPLIATLLTDLIRRNCDAPLKSFSFRAIKPVFDTAPFAVCGAPGEDDKIDLWAMDCDGALCMRAQATTG